MEWTAMTIVAAKRRLTPLADRGPLRVMFVITSMPVGGAETLLVNLVRRLNRNQFLPELCCLKSFGPLGEVLNQEIPAYENLLRSKYDAGVWFRLSRLFDQRKIDAIVTVGAGDKMFWGRLAAWRAGVPVVLSALHSTGWPDTIGRLNRMLTPITDGFIAVAGPHGRHLVEGEGFPADKVHVIPNGVDVERFAPRSDRNEIRARLGIAPNAPLVGIVAALRPEKNHELFLRSAAQVRSQCPRARFLIVGDGPERPALECLARELELNAAVNFLGTRDDIPELLSALDVFALTSRMEANPVSILEAMASGVPVVAPRVGSIAESVIDGETGYLVEASNLEEVARRTCQLIEEPDLARSMGEAGRKHVVEHGSLERMVAGYQNLFEQIYLGKCDVSPRRRRSDCLEQVQL